MRILQIVHQFLPRARARAGGELGTYQTLRALTEIGHEVRLVVCDGPYDLEPEVERRVAGVHWLSPRTPSRVQRLGARVFTPDTWRLRTAEQTGFPEQLRHLAANLKIDLVWADSTASIAMAPRRELPTIYGHYDFLYLLKPVRAATRPRADPGDILRGAKGWRNFRKNLRRPDALSVARLKQLELRHCREASLVVTVSPSVESMLRERDIRARYIPIVGSTIPHSEATPSEVLRLFLFGNNNTANRAILREIRDRLHPMLARRNLPLEWHQVGTVKESERDEDWRWAETNFTRMHGFVPELADVMRPGDISIVAYPFDTGGRAKLAVTAGLGVASAGYATSFLCAPEFAPGIDCVAATDAEALATELAALAQDRARRVALAERARATYDAHFTFEAQLPRFEHAVEDALATFAARSGSNWSTSAG